MFARRYFLSTLGMKSDGAIFELVKCKKSSLDGLSPVPIGKGKHKRNVQHSDTVKEHVNSFAAFRYC